MAKTSVLTQADLDNLLRWLDPDRERAGQKYEKVRRALIKIFAARGCYHAEDLADETITRVSHKAEGLLNTYKGDHSLFFYGVAKNVYREYLKTISRNGNGSRSNGGTQTGKAAVAGGDSEGMDDSRLECMMKCLREFPKGEREIVTQYYEEEKSAKIESRKRLASRHGLSLNALRLKASRLRRSLRQCVLKCMGKYP
jgi:RNA polymerase sigma factor (sigma-70 family)